MEKILVLTDKYYPRPYANAMCAQELIRSFKTQGHTVDVLAYEDPDENPNTWEDNYIYYVRPDMRLRLFYYADKYKRQKTGKVAFLAANALSKAKKVLLLPWQPFYSFSFPSRIYKKMDLLYQENGYDAIVAILNPLDSCIAACKFKQKHPQIPFVVFSVDTLRKTFLKQRFGKQFADGFFWEKRILTRCDAFFYMRARRGDYKLSRYDPYRNKLHETDMPRLKIKDCTSIPKFDFGEKAEHWVYAGTISRPHYDPAEMIEIFKALPSTPLRVLHLYTRGAGADYIEEKAKNEGLSIRVHSYVDAVTLNSIMASADVIVSLKTSAHISAKIFECMSYLKPVVHFSGHKEDPNAYYLHKYALGHVVEMYGEREKQIKGLEQFLKVINEKSVGAAELKALFWQSTPEYSAEKICRCIENASDVKCS